MKKVSKTEFQSIHGCVIVYTRRHINGCKFRDPNENHCSCPKWIYSKPKGGKAVQRAAGTPSYTEACAEAQRILKGFDPEIAAAREINEPKPGITIEAAIELYESALVRRGLSEKYIRDCVRVLRSRPKGAADAENLSLLGYLDKINVAAREQILYMEQLRSDHLDAWAATWAMNDLTSRVRRGTVITFLKWAVAHEHMAREPKFREKQKVKKGNRCGYFSDGQIEKLRASLPFYRIKFHKMPENFAARMGALIDLGRWAGMAIADIVLFSPRSISDQNVLAYRRKKTGEIAQILLDPAVAARLRSIPLEQGCDPDRPFHFAAICEEENRKCWRKRFNALCKFAGIDRLETETGAPKKPHVHALRDSFAIDMLVRGVTLENVARALGHSTTQMTERNYLPWIKRRIDHCIEDQRAALRRVQAAEPEAASPEPVQPAIIQ